MKYAIAVLSILMVASACGQSKPPACGTESNPCWLSPERPWVAPKLVPEITVDALWGTAASADLMLSERCISAHTCHEANPLLPANASITGASVLEVGETGLSMWAFHRFRKHYPKLAWIIPGVNIGMHAASIIHIEYVRSNLPVKGQR